MKSGVRRFLCGIAFATLALSSLASCARDGSRRERLREAMQHASEPANLPAGTRAVRDVAYGSDPLQRFDVYTSSQAKGAPVIFMVHGGGWRRGDKAARGVIENKIARWVPHGFVFISTNYRLRPATAPLQQARDVALALATAQRRAAEWGSDPHRVILMGHSAGAHLIALLTAEPDLARAQGVLSWLGTVTLDSASLNVVQTMQGRHFSLYDEAFGNNPSDWLAASPYQQMRGSMSPLLAVCSTRRRDSCPQAHAFAGKAKSLGNRASVLEEDMRHGRINQQLGLPSDYTRQVEVFLGSLDPGIAYLLGNPQAD